MSIQVFLPKYRVDECLEQIRECLECGWTGMGFKTIEFENLWKTYTGLPNAHFLNSATSGLHLALHLMKKKYGWSDGDEIITTPLTFVSTNHSILYENLKPVFADVDEYLCLDPKSIEKAVNSKTRAVVFVGLGGNVGKYHEVQAICQKYGLKLILDAAHMAGTRVNGEHVGKDADCTVFSFQAVKNLPTADSGMICFSEASDDKHARRLSWLGIDKDTFARTNQTGAYKWKYGVDELGFKYHGNSIMAALGIVGLKYLDKDNERRREIADRYKENLQASELITFTPFAPNCIPSTHFVQIQIERRDDLIEHLNSNNVFPGVHYISNTEYGLYRESFGLCPRAEEASRTILSLPVHLSLSNDDVDKISELILNFLEG